MTLKQWDLESNSCIRTLQGHSSTVLCLAADVDADLLLSGDRGNVLRWDIKTGQQLDQVEPHAYGGVQCLSITPDGSCFVSGSSDCSLTLRRVEALQQPVLQFHCSTGYVNACVVSSDGSRLYSGSKDSLVRVWDMNTGQQLDSMQSHTDGVSSLALSGSLLVSGSYDKTVKLWDTESMQLLHTLRGHSQPVQSVAVSSDGSQRVFSGGGYKNGAKDCSIRVWDAASGSQLAVLKGHSDTVWYITVSSDGRLAASASCDETICVWDLATLSLCARLEGHSSSVFSVLFV